MSKNGSKKEFILAYYLARTKAILEAVLGIKIGGTLLEFPFGGQKIDLFTKEKGSKIPIFIEMQRTKSDNDHRERIKKLINKKDNFYICWIAESFRDYDIEEIISIIKENKKAVRFYAFVINPKIPVILDELNKDIRKMPNRLHMFNGIKEPLKTIKKYESNKLFDATSGEGEKEPNPRVVNNKRLLKALRDKVPDYPDFYRAKARLENRIIAFGFGKADVGLFLSLENQRGQACVFVRFNEKNKQVFERIKTNRRRYTGIFHHSLRFDEQNLVIGVFKKADSNVNDNINFLVSITANMVKYFEKYIHEKNSKRANC